MHTISDCFEIDIENLLKFFDEKPPASQGHATSLTQMFGEDLGAALFIHCLNSRGIKSKVISDKCTTGKRRGSRLDRWILANENEKRVFYQAEIKNWSAHAIGGKKISVTASPEDLAVHGEEKWLNIWDPEKGNFKWTTLSKVLKEMELPVGYQDNEVRPLLIYWIPLRPKGESSPFFNVQAKSAAFNRVWVFSMSSYLRSINEDKIVLKNMANFAKRWYWIDKIFKPI